MPVPGADVYGRGEISTLMIYGARSLGMGLTVALLSFPILYFSIFHKSIKNEPIGIILNLFLISAFIMAPMIRWMLEFSSYSGLVVAPALVVPLFVIGFFVLATNSQGQSAEHANAGASKDLTDQGTNEDKPQTCDTNRLIEKFDDKGISNADENAIYSTISEEIKTERVDKGLWTRLYAECDGDERKIKVEYIKLRFAVLKAKKGKEQAAQDFANKEVAQVGAQLQISTEQAHLVEIRKIREAEEVESRRLARELFLKTEAEAISIYNIEKQDFGYKLAGRYYYTLDDAIADAQRKIHVKHPSNSK
jgi:hypothetical protein